MSVQALLGQLLLGLINGAFYASSAWDLRSFSVFCMSSNFAHGALYTTGAFVALLLLNHLRLGYAFALVFAPIGVGFWGPCSSERSCGAFISSTLSTPFS